MENSTATNEVPYEKCVVEINGRFDSEYGTLTAALKAGLKLLRKCPHSRVKVRDENERIRTLVNLPGQSQEKIEAALINVVSADEIKYPSNRVDPTADRTSVAFWRGQVVYENGRVKRFETENEAREFLARCDLAGKILH